MSGFLRALRPLLLLVLASAAVLAALDWGLFRSGLYAHLIKPGSTAGALVGAMKAIDAHHDPGRRNVLVLGNSRVAEGFSGKLADAAVGHGNLHFINGATPGTSLRVWYYMLREIDPAADRFDAIAMMVSYDLEGTRQVLADNPLDTRYLVSLLRVTDALDYPATFLDDDQRDFARRGTLFPLSVLREDVLDFVSAPRTRLREVHHRDAAWASAVANYRGNARALPELAIDPVSGQPSDWGADAKKTKALLGGYFKQLAAPAPGSAQVANLDYQDAWLQRILDRYTAAGVPVIVFAVPRGPYHAAMGRSLRMSDTIAGLAREGRLAALPAADFTVLEQPRYFFDAQHMNRAGREEFSAMLAERVAPLLP